MGHDLVICGILLVIIIACFIFIVKAETEWGRRRRTWFLAFVILCFVVYPILYLRDDDGFAQSDPNQEPAFKIELQHVSSILTAKVRTAVASEPNPGNKPVGYATVDLQDVDSHNIFGTISYADSGDGTAVSNLDSQIEIREAAIPSAAGYHSDQAALPYWASGRYKGPKSSDGDAAGAALAQQLFIQYTSKFHGDSKLFVTGDELSEIIKLKKAAGGQVGSLSGRWSLDNVARMEYFSAVTMTTLGYGDIVPVEWSSRITVASEAVLGLVTIGLLLNAIWLKHSDRAPQDGGNQSQPTLGAVQTSRRSAGSPPGPMLSWVLAIVVLWRVISILRSQAAGF
jgi:Ion channel